MQYTGFYDQSYRADRYRRLDLTNDVLYYTYRFGPMTVLYPKHKNTVTVFSDTYARQMADRGIITQDALRAYENAVCQVFAQVDSHREKSAEQVYHLICRLRRQALGAQVMEKAREQDRLQTVDPTEQGIFEEKQKQQLCAESKAAVFVLYESQYFARMLQDMEEVRSAGHRIYLLVSGETGDVLPTEATYRKWLDDVTDVCFLQTYPTDLGSVLENVQWDDQVEENIARNAAAVFAYGEEALLACRSLRTDAFVTASPRGYCAQAVTNQLGCVSECAVYVPAHLDITAFVPLTEKTKLSFWHLAMLRRDMSADIDSMPLEELYRCYPAYFLNRYENGDDCAAARPDFPISVGIPREEPDPVGNFEQYREAAVADYLNSFPGLSYQHAFFDDSGVLVHSVRVKRAKGSRVIACGNGVTLRQRLRQEGTGIVSNFLFFLTAKLATLYNDLRKDRPHEQAQLAGEHLDYMLTRENGVRRETFPLFQKMCIGMKKNGEFLFFNFRLGGGKVRIGTQWITWQKQDVDPMTPADVCVYTPYGSCADGDADRQTYRKAVGQGRVNFVFLQDRLHCVRNGDVILPSVGVVVSLEKTVGTALLEQLQLPPLDDGYYACDGLPTQIYLQPPAGIDPGQWEQLQWAYGGGLSLILDHKAVTDLDNMLPWFDAEGWMSPLSRQTQESTLHTLAKHPRTAIGIADNGDLLILVFSGRTRRSAGADYREMCHIARTLYPDVHSLMNADGGGSAVLGLVCGGQFMELSYPSTSVGSTVGMARPIQTAFYIAQEESVL